MSNVSSNKKKGAGRLRFAGHGKPGSGKTFSAASWVDKCPPFNGNRSKWTKLNALWLSADTNATVGLAAKKIEVPEIDIAAMLADAPNDTLDILSEVVDDAHEYVEKHKPDTVVLDTASKLDKAICRFWEENGPKTKSGARDSFAIWRNVVKTHDRFHTDLDALPCHVVFLMHSKPRSDSDSSEKKKRAQSTAGALADIRFDFMYEDVANIYRRDTDMIFIAEYAKKGGNFERSIYVEENSGFEAKNRFQDIVPGRNMKGLGEVRKAIEAALK